jgi:FOG: EAL domain
MFVECSQEDITSKINDFINKINELLVSKELGIDIFINIGVSFYDKDGDSFEVLREKANIALQEAKKEGPGTYRFYNEDISSSLKKYKEAQELLERALDKRLFKFFYQPYFDIKTKDFVGFEALIRIIDEDGSVISPYKFIDYLESSSYFLNRFQEVFLKMVEKDMNTFISKAKSHFSSAFNISANSFKDDIFMSKLIGLCHKFEDKLVIEITERMLLSDFEKAKEILRNIRSVGSKIALDDFGTYYSSLSYVKNVELDIIKIDISFVKDIVFDKRSLAVVKVIINLAKALNIKTIAEGVENEE